MTKEEALKEADALEREWEYFQAIYDDLTPEERLEWFRSRTQRANELTKILKEPEE